MPHDAYATEDEAKDYLRGLKLPVLDDPSLDLLKLQQKLDRAVTQWENLTKWRPFLAVPDETRFFDAMQREWTHDRVDGGATLRLPCGVVSLTSLHVGLTPTDPVGVVKVEGTDFWLTPTSSTYTGQPFTAIKFRIRPVIMPYYEKQSIKAVGTFGFATEIADDVWEALLEYAVGLAMPQVGMMVNSGMQIIKSDASEMRFLPDAFTGMAAKAEAELRRLARTSPYRRILM